MKIKSILSAVAGIILFNACTDLSENLYDKAPSSDYGKTPGEIETIVGAAYASLRGGSDDDGGFWPTCEFVFFLNAVASDECVVPARGTDWYDKGVYLELQRHTWTPSNEKIISGWKYGYNGVTSVNSVIYQVEQSGLDEESAKPIYAELRALRAYFYAKLMDMYGNIPIVTDFTQLEMPANSSRADVFKFIEKELLETVDLLPENAYGRFTKNAAYTLLARLYLNAEVYTGTARWEDCIDACGNVTGQLEDDYFASFQTENQRSKEIIFSIPYDHKVGTEGNYMASLTYHYEQKWVFSATGNYPWTVNGICGQPGLYSAFDEGDVRRKAMCQGPQIDKRTGQTLIMPASGMPLNYTEEVSDVTDALQNEGVRLSKYEDKEGDQVIRDYDFVLMRYAEVLMMQAECYVRLNKESSARPFVEQIRTRAGMDTPDNIDLDFINEELRREFVFEDHRRTDNIRFGDFFDAWWEKGADAADKHTAIFPIPEKILKANTKLVQNPGYPK